MRKLAVLFFVILCACSSTNKNVVQVAETGIGMKVSVSDVAQTYLPDVYFGFYRSVVLIVPTSSNDANRTCDMILDFQVDAGFMTGIKISDKVVVGAPARNASNDTVKTFTGNSDAGKALFAK